MKKMKIKAMGHEGITKTITMIMVALYVIGIGLHIIGIIQSKEQGSWSYFYEGRYRFKFDIPFITAIISLIAQHYFYSHMQSIVKKTSEMVVKIIRIALIVMNIVALLLSYYYFVFYAIPITFVGQSMFISTVFIVIANLLKSLNQDEKNEGQDFI